MSSSRESSNFEPRFFFLMPVWGKVFIDYLLTFGLPTLLSPNNIPSLPNLAHSQFTFLTTEDDEKLIRESHLFGILSALMPVKFIHQNFHQAARQEKFNQLGEALKLGAEEALGRGFCFFFHPDGLYSDGMLKFLYQVAKSGKKACVSHGPVATLETLKPYLQKNGHYRFDEINAIPPRPLAHALMDNLHPDMTVHCMENPSYPKVPYMGFWLSPTGDGALFRFMSLHPWMVDLSEHSQISEFGAIDHNFIRRNGFIWSEVHVETDSDKFLVVGVKPKDDMNAIKSDGSAWLPEERLVFSLLGASNCNYSRFCFFTGMKVHFENLNKDWRAFESRNLEQLNALLDTSTIVTLLGRRPLFSFVRQFFIDALLKRDPRLAINKTIRTLRRSITLYRADKKNRIRDCQVCDPSGRRCIDSVNSAKH